MVLKDIIIEKIRSDGPITFRDYMDMCLYYPDKGYYSTNRQKIGKSGDFYTSSSLTRSFGTTIARQMEEMWRYLGQANFTVVEYGAGLGSLCQDILNQLSENEELYKGLRYCIVEKSGSMRQKEQEILNGHPKVSWYNHIKEIPTEINCVFSNELLDNFPVHQVVMQGELMEIFVDYKASFYEMLRPASQQLKDYFKLTGMNLPEGYRAEICLDALAWVNDITTCLKKGYVITIDYGDVSERLYKEHRKDGTVVCYNKHQVSQNPFCYIGEQDITAHVNFSALKNWGESNGLTTCGFTYQAYFLSSLGFQEDLQNRCMKDGNDVMTTAKEAAIISYTLLFDMGNKYKVLIQSKGMPETRLTGLRLASRNS